MRIYEERGRLSSDMNSVLRKLVVPVLASALGVAVGTPTGQWLSTIAPIPAAAGTAIVVAFFLLLGLSMPALIRRFGGRRPDS